MRILHVEDPFSIEERAEKKADIRQIFKPPMFRRGLYNHIFYGGIFKSQVFKGDF